jgi:hypothetical protein
MAYGRFITYNDMHIDLVVSLKAFPVVVDLVFVALWYCSYDNPSLDYYQKKAQRPAFTVISVVKRLLERPDVCGRK